MKFHVGQRVRVLIGDKCRGRVATITGTSIGGRLGRDGKVNVWRGVLLYLLDVDGVGEIGLHGLHIACLPSEIEPIDDRPEAGSWDEICALTRGWRPGVVTHDA